MGKEDAASSGIAQGEERPPPLPPRPAPAAVVGKPTTAVSSMNIQTLSFPDGSRGTFSTTSDNAPASSDPASSSADQGIAALGFNSAVGNSRANDIDDSMSVMSFAPTLRPPGDLESLLIGDGDMSKKSPAWVLLRSQSAIVQPFESVGPEQTKFFADFAREFQDIPDESEKDWTDEDRIQLWKSKLKHYMILSSAGKPIYSRHGDLALTNSSMGVVQTIISFYEGAKNPLLGFTAGDTRFVIATRGPLYFVAISKLGESDSQLRAQLDALYMQILSTLTLPALTNIFANRPSTDLRKPLQGTESLLSSLADSFTKGSPSAILGALECLRLRKSHRLSINNAFLRTRADKLLYGLIVAGGKLVSVIRPRRHSLHPSDLQLIFNMLFESGGIKSGGGENWIPLCLPAFNNRGYLYMYVSFLDGQPPDQGFLENPASVDEEIAIILISPDKESFFALQQMRDDVVAELKKKGHLDIIKAAAKRGRSTVHEIAPGTHVSHFLFKSRANVQFCMPSLQPSFANVVSHRRLMNLYSHLHATVHAKHSHLKILHCVNVDFTSLAWVTPIFELYCVAGPNASRAVMTQGANKILQWAKREEERLFIIGGGVF
ncbi:trafficking protein Mon1-domain-containing protein [Biscogniauxia marginata]|nr:trafficking protein Mon1-domain-containing protein [Biscogniauxia marginata]